MKYSRLVPFDRPLAGAVLPGRKGRFVTESELSALEEKAFHRGADAARAKVDQQIVELRTDMQHLGENVLGRLAAMEPALVAQLNAALPGLAVDLARRLLAGYEPPAEVVARLCAEALAELFPERENLELVVSRRDAALLDGLGPEWRAGYPGLRIRAEASLGPGDCQVRSRFGLTDARRATKLEALAQHLVPA